MKRRSRGSSLDPGMTLVEVVLIVAVLTILTGWVRPLAKKIVYAQKLQKVNDELHIIAKGIENYYIDNHTGTADATYGYFPTDIGASGFFGVYYPADTDIYMDEFMYTENDHSDLWRSYRYTASGTPKIAYVYSVGPDGADDQLVGGGDDIVVEVRSEVMGRNLTRKKLRDIGRAVVDYIVGNKLVSSSDAWSLTESATLCSTNFGLDTWYDKDGFGRQWEINTSYYRIYSSGPNGTDDTGDNATALASDDIGW